MLLSVNEVPPESQFDTERDLLSLFLAEEALKCQYGTLEITRNVSQLPFQWTAGQTTCGVGEGCQDTLMMIENGETGPLGTDALLLGPAPLDLLGNKRRPPPQPAHFCLSRRDGEVDSHKRLHNS